MVLLSYENIGFQSLFSGNPCVAHILGVISVVRLAIPRGQNVIAIVELAAYCLHQTLLSIILRTFSV